MAIRDTMPHVVPEYWIKGIGCFELVSCGVITVLEFTSAILLRKSNFNPPDAVGNGLEIPYLSRRCPYPTPSQYRRLYPHPATTSATASNSHRMHHAGPTGILTPGVISPCICPSLE
jgi:hypothetical protein